MTWTEVNLWPAGNPGDLLRNVTVPLIRLLARDITAWHFFWETEIGGEDAGLHLRLRVLWRRRPKIRKLAAFLDQSPHVSRWHEGSHGAKGETYPGERDEYGDAWEATYRDWMSSANLALDLARLRNRLPHDRCHYLRRRLHLVINQFGGEDAAECLNHAWGYLELAAQKSEDEAARSAVADMMDAIDAYFTKTAPGSRAEPAERAVK